jgi:hypothetical protein
MTPIRKRATALASAALVLSAGWLAGCDDHGAAPATGAPVPSTGSAPPTSTGPRRTLDLTPPGASHHPTVKASVRPGAG